MSNIAQIMAECDCQHTQCETLGYCMAARIIELEAEATEMEENFITIHYYSLLFIGWGMKTARVREGGEDELGCGSLAW